MIDLGWFGYIAWDAAFFSALMAIIVINLILSGDNAVVIALAVRNLPKKQRMWGIILGSGLAVVLRVVLTFFAAQLLLISFLKFFGGALILWIAVKLFTSGHEEEHVEAAAGLWQAIKVILIADLVMSIDNVLAIAGASKGNMFSCSSAWHKHPSRGGHQRPPFDADGQIPDHHHHRSRHSSCSSDWVQAFPWSLAPAPFCRC